MEWLTTNLWLGWLRMVDITRWPTLIAETRPPRLWIKTKVVALGECCDRDSLVSGVRRWAGQDQPGGVKSTGWSPLIIENQDPSSKILRNRMEIDVVSQQVQLVNRGDTISWPSDLIPYFLRYQATMAALKYSTSSRAQEGRSDGFNMF